MSDFRYTAEIDDEILDAVLGYVSPAAAWLPCTEIAIKYKIGRMAFGPHGWAHTGKPVWNRVWDIAISDGVYTGPTRTRRRDYQRPAPTGVEIYMLATAATARGPSPPAACVTPPTPGYMAHVLSRPVEWVIDHLDPPATASRITGYGGGFNL